MAKKILCFGDSNTFGFDSRSYIGDRFPKNIRWTGILDDMPEYEIINKGMNGREIPDDDWDLGYVEKMLKDNAPFDLMVIMLGTNDMMFTFQRRIDPVVNRMKGFLDFIINECQLPAEKILLLAPPQLELERYGQGHLDALSRQLGPAYEKLAKQYGTFFADTVSWNLTLATDGAHLTEESHSVFAEHMKEVLKSII